MKRTGAASVIMPMLKTVALGKANPKNISGIIQSITGMVSAHAVRNLFLAVARTFCSLRASSSNLAFLSSLSRT